MELEASVTGAQSEWERVAIEEDGNLRQTKDTGERSKEKNNEKMKVRQIFEALA